MSLEPAIAVVIGFLVLHQNLDVVAVVGIGLVVTAGIGAERGGARVSELDQRPPAQRAALAPGHEPHHV